ncbi:uncharacterized protein LOC129617050 [Condylostylus longicornis]|uniref:uncharacterized protein LOC129617050 n=1 Tax=Condylostylus longicornis TaxID=2530218 RepID=UPI00244E4F29|nr:uncharacterized protein LOC129617050 [Condylostylus longicornis]
MKECLYQVLQTEPIEVEQDVWVKCEEKSEDRPTSGGNQVMYVVTYKVCVYSKKQTVHYLKKVVDRWLKEYKDYKRDQLSGKQLIFMVRFPEQDFNNNNSTPTEDVQFSTFKTFRSFDNLFFEKKDEVLHDINFFLHEKEWHKKRGLPDSLGILCYGVPGCGKTSFIKALLKKTNRHGVIFSVNRQTRLESIEKLMRSEVLCDFPIPQDQRVYILEDIDAMGDLVTKRVNPTDDKPEEEMDDEAKKEVITREKEEEIFERQLFKWLKYGISKSSDHHLGFFLNLLDGLIETPGRIIVMTTNHIENLDPALIRPGRIDINIEFVKCSRVIVKQIISHFYNRGIDDWELDEEVTDDQITPAELTQICRANKFEFDGALHDLNKWMAAKKRSLEEQNIEPVEVTGDVEAKDEDASRPDDTMALRAD